MDSVIATVEESHDGSWWTFVKLEGALVVGAGDSCQEAMDSLLDGIAVAKDDYEQEGRTVPEGLSAEISFEADPFAG